MQTDEITGKILAMMGLCRRAGKLSAGFDLVIETIRSKKAQLALAAADISEKTFKNLKYEADQCGVPCLRVNADMAALGKACGIKAGVAVVTDEGLAKALLKLMQESTEGGEQP